MLAYFHGDWLFDDFSISLSGAGFKSHVSKLAQIWGGPLKRLPMMVSTCSLTLFKPHSLATFSWPRCRSAVKMFS